MGLGAGKAGNSEAGHSNLGAGRCVMQDDVRLDAAVQDGSFARNPVFLEAIEHARRNHASLHLLAYLTHKSSHGCIDYPLAICEMAKEAGPGGGSTSTSSSTAAPPNPAPPPRCWRSWTAAWTRSGWGGSWTALAGAWSWTGTRITTR